MPLDSTFRSSRPDCLLPGLLLSQLLWPVFEMAHRSRGSGDSRRRWERARSPLLPQKQNFASVYFSAPAVLSALMRRGAWGGERRPPAPWLSASPKAAALSARLLLVFNVLAAPTARPGRRSQPGRWSGLKAL